MSKKKSNVREPLFHIVKRSSVSTKQSLLIRTAAIFIALVVAGIFTFILTKKNPLDVYITMFEGAFGTTNKVFILLHEIALLMCLSLAVTPAFKMKFWNIGAEGQTLAGGLAAALCMLLFGDKLHPVIIMLVMIVTSILAGVIWAVIPAFFKANWNTNETLFTLMMNYVAMQLVSYVAFKFSSSKGSGSIGTINDETYAGWFPEIFGNRYTLNIMIVVVLTVIMYVYLKHSKHGYEISVVGESENTARYIGINVKKVILRTMALSGAICGIAGLLMVAGADHTIDSNTVDGRGFTAIMVSWLAKFNPVMMFLTSFLIVFMQIGAAENSTELGIDTAFSDILTGIILFFIIGSEFFINYSIKFRKPKKEVANK